MKETIVSLRMTKEQVAALERIAKRDDRPVSWLIRKAIDEFVQRDKERK